jgi:formate/nitrite transporter FocA (FNT family)
MAVPTEERTTIRETPGGDAKEISPGFTEQDIEDIEESSRPRAPMIHEIPRREGEEEMARPAMSLWWSGVAAGLSISFSLLTQAVLYLHLPDSPWRSPITGLGYSVGFLLVILARQQLFTENTITAVLPVAVCVTVPRLARLGRLWAIMLAANPTGTLFAALFCEFTPALSPNLRGAMLELSSRMIEGGPVVMSFKAISAGYLIAAMVWLLPSADGARWFIILY